MLKKILAGLAVAAVAFLGYVAAQPSDYRVERSATIAAAPGKVFDHVNDFQMWEAWSPWAKLDPNVKNTFSGPSSGTGSVFAWAGNGEVGEGKMTITESVPGELVRITLEFVKPFADTATVEFTFRPAGDGTAVTWAMFGKKDFTGKLFGLLMNCDKMLGDYFDKGLAQMKAVAEAEPAG